MKKFIEFFLLIYFFNIKTYPSPAIRDCVTRNYILSSSMWVVELMKLREASLDRADKVKFWWSVHPNNLVLISF